MEVHADYKLFERKTNPKFVKQVPAFGAKPSFSNIDAYYLIEEATKVYGLYGKGFGLREISYEKMHLENKTILLILTATFFYGEASFPITNSDKLFYISAKGKEILDTDIFKKLETNTIGKSLSKIGFGTDIYMGKFEDSNYVNDALGETAITIDQLQQLTPLITKTDTDLKLFNKEFGIGKLSELQVKDFNRALALLHKKLEKKQDANNK